MSWRAVHMARKIHEFRNVFTKFSYQKQSILSHGSLRKVEVYCSVWWYIPLLEALNVNMASL